MIVFIGMASNQFPLEASNIHIYSEACRYETVSECNSLCEECHGEPWHPLELYRMQKGDFTLCTPCHVEQRKVSNKSYFLPHKTRHHRVDVIYETFNKRLKLRPEPIAGPKLFCDTTGTNCRIFCSSCHSPHNERGSMMRVEGMTALCIKCHQK